jgi:ribonuclease T1
MSSKRRVALAVGVVVVAIAVLLLTRQGNHVASPSGGASAGGPLTTVTLAPTPRPPSTAPGGATVAPARTASSGPATTRVATTTPKGVKTVRAADLPPEARTTLRLIASDGPFPYRQDGVVFENREHHLPGMKSGYYHEYTVVTPGSSDRGARRVITGGAGERFYTDDHYATFRLVVDA